MVSPDLSGDGAGRS